MKKLYFVLFVSFLSQIVLAQDVIVKRDGSSIISKVLEVNTDDVKYKKFSNLNGPTYTTGTPGACPHDYLWRLECPTKVSQGV